MKTQQVKLITKKGLLENVAGDTARGLLTAQRMNGTIELSGLDDFQVISLDDVKLWILRSPKNLGRVLNVNQTSLTDGDFRKIERILNASRGFTMSMKTMPPRTIQMEVTKSDRTQVRVSVGTVKPKAKRKK
jgi:hypothetical protein